MRLLRRRRGRGGVPVRPARPLGVGEQDLYPPGMPYLPPLGPLVPQGGHGGGMLVGPDHPAFFPFGGGGVGPGHPPQLPPGVPPGARFDPYGARTRTLLAGCLLGALACLTHACRAGAGPPGVPGFEPDRFGGERGRGGPVLPGQPRPVHPDVMQLGGDDERDARPFG